MRTKHWAGISSKNWMNSSMEGDVGNLCCLEGQERAANVWPWTCLACKRQEIDSGLACKSQNSQVEDEALKTVQSA